MIDDKSFNDINDLLCFFMQSFDDKDWQKMRDCLADQVCCDYSSFRDVAAATIDGDRYVAQREAALTQLDMQHNFMNLRISVSEKKATGRCNYAIHRFLPDGDENAFFHSYGHYDFGFEQKGERWRINSIVQTLLRNHGNAEIHGATRSTNNTRDI